MLNGLTVLFIENDIILYICSHSLMHNHTRMVVVFQLKKRANKLQNCVSEELEWHNTGLR
jgi:hypothetical protein